MLNKKNYKEKTYNRCLFCEHRGVRCNGPRTSDMTLERWREFMRDMKEVEGLTYAEISKRSNIPSKTIEKKLSPGGDGQDIMRETARLIEDAIIGSSNQYPCYLSFLEAEQHPEKITPTDPELERIHAFYQRELQAVRDEAQRKIDHLLGQIEYMRNINDKNSRIIEKLLKD